MSEAGNGPSGTTPEDTVRINSKAWLHEVILKSERYNQTLVMGLGKIWLVGMYKRKNENMLHCALFKIPWEIKDCCKAEFVIRFVNVVS